MNHGSTSESQLIRHAIESRSAECLQQVIHIVKKSGVIDQVREKAFRYSELALQALRNLPYTTYRETLESLTKFALHRLG